MNPFSKALQNGHGIDEILGFLTKAYPQLGNKIKQATKLGYTGSAAVGLMSKLFESESYPSMMTPNQISSSQRNKEGSQVKEALMSFGTGLASQALTRSAGSVGSQMLQPAQAPQLGGSPPQPGPNQPAQITQSPPGQPAQNAQVPSPQSPQQPGPNSPISNQPLQSIVSPLATKTQIETIPGFTKKISDMAGAGNNAEQIAAFLTFNDPKNAKLLEKQANKPLQEVIAEYLPNIQQQAQQPISPIIPQQALQPIQQVDQPIDQKKVIESPKPMKIEKGSLALSPSGIAGMIESVSGNKALINVNGKIKQVDKDSLISSPIPEKDLADLYSDVIGGIKKSTGKEVSRSVYWAGYDPSSNELIYIPHDGGAYIYDDISEEDKNELVNFLTVRKSTGLNHIGAWDEGSESPIGAAMFKLIQKLQKERGGKGKEYKNKFLSIYDALEPAKKALKEKHVQAKKAQKSRLA